MERSRNKIAWRCRRGLLELDLLLSQFVKNHLHSLNEEQLGTFASMLELQDNELLDILIGRQIVGDSKMAEMVSMIS